VAYKRALAKLLSRAKTIQIALQIQAQQTASYESLSMWTEGLQEVLTSKAHENEDCSQQEQQLT
jgi:hypothetical protein